MDAGGSRAVGRGPAAVAAPGSSVYLSAASAWEMAIKRSIGRLEAPRDVVEAIGTSGFIELPIGLRHAQSVDVLPPHHADPFDRILIAQAQVERLTIVTRDPAFNAYDVPLLGA